MLTIVVLDRLAESRTKLVEEFSQYIRGDVKDIDLVPRVNLIPLSRQEIKFHAAPDICIIGSSLIESDVADVANIRKQLPNSALVARLRRTKADLSIVEQLARMGVDDVIYDDIEASEFLKKVILLSRRANHTKSGKLVLVDSGKGGVGVTTICAALAESLVRSGKSVATIDCDFETQDLSRFLQARPFVNENLQLLFDHSRPVTQEFVEQCLVPVWENEERLRCMTPVPESEGLYESQSTYPRTLISILEVLDAMYDCILVDVGCLRGAMLRTLYRLADNIIFVVNNDPATLYASVDRLRVSKAYIAPDAKLTISVNALTNHGLSEKILKDEILRILALSEESWCDAVVPFCKHGCRWPGSGATLHALGKGKVQDGINALAATIGVVTANDKKTKLASISELLLKFIERTIRPGQSTLKAPVTNLQLPNTQALAELPEPEFYISTQPVTDGHDTNSDVSTNTEQDLRKLVSGARFS